MLQNITYPCTKCGGVGKVDPPAPTNLYSEHYSQYQRGVRGKAIKCSKCAGAGKLTRVNPAWLVDTRTRKGLTRKTFSEQTGITYIYLTSVECGFANCTPEILGHYLKLI